MIKPIVRKGKIDDINDDYETITYWLGKSVEERMNAMGILHRQHLIILGYKEIPRIKKVVKKVKVF